MVGFKNQFLFVAVVLLALVHLGSSIKCFQCGEEVGGDGVCRDDTGSKHATKDCASNHVCVTHHLGSFSVAGQQSPETLIRVCADPSYCNVHAKLVEKTLGASTKSCKTCQSNYCNSGSTVVPSFIVVALLTARYLFS